MIAYLCTYLNKCGLSAKLLAKRFRAIFVESPEGSIDLIWEKEVVKTFIEEINYLQENTTHLEHAKDDPKDYIYSSLANKPYSLRAEALYDYRSTNKWIPSFKQGSVFELYDIKANESGWLLGAVIGSGREGFVPESYLSIIPEDATNLTWEHKLPPEESDRLFKTMEARKIHATEILTTERTYVENLKLLEGILTTLKENNMGLSTSDIMTMFPSVETLRVCHEKLLEVFEKCLKEWSNDSMMGKVFVENVNIARDFNSQYLFDFHAF